MSIPLRTEEEIVKLREACKLASDVLMMIEPYVKEGVTTGELDRICHDYMVNVQKVIPACLNYHGFPKATCISINEVVCHGIPSFDKHLKNGDIVNIDVTGDKRRLFLGITRKCISLARPIYAVKSWWKRHKKPFMSVCVR